MCIGSIYPIYYTRKQFNYPVLVRIATPRYFKQERDTIITAPDSMADKGAACVLKEGQAV